MYGWIFTYFPYSDIFTFLLSLDNTYYTRSVSSYSNKMFEKCAKKNLLQRYHVPNEYECILNNGVKWQEGEKKELEQS